MNRQATAARTGTRLVVGAIVYCRHYAMPARVTRISGTFVYLIRPSGLQWRSARVAVRPATDWEHKQYRALAKLQTQRERGLRSLT
ncbi:hypothetical protein [Streptomyces sp. TRM64462]|uniref:hypothetical protein n=1 Tax=Streptomyces sp. TRM64462 TaxID=2741726 RepID=UPI001586E4F8|nr:hypothetical protein [Streptomyces sp. TRM64462]